MCHDGCSDAAAVGTFKDFVVHHVVLLFDSKDWAELLLVELFELPYIATVDIPYFSHTAVWRLWRLDIPLASLASGCSCSTLRRIMQWEEKRPVAWFRVGPSLPDYAPRAVASVLSSAAQIKCDRQYQGRKLQRTAATCVSLSVTFIDTPSSYEGDCLLYSSY